MFLNLGCNLVLFSTVLKFVSRHRDVLPCYFVRATAHLIVACVTHFNAGAVVIDSSGAIISAPPSKRAALAFIRA